MLLFALPREKGAGRDRGHGATVLGHAWHDREWGITGDNSQGSDAAEVTCVP